jgi:hypothetical protein
MPHESKGWRFTFRLRLQGPVVPVSKEGGALAENEAVLRLELKAQGRVSDCEDFRGLSTEILKLTLQAK